MAPPTWTNIADDLSELSDPPSDFEDDHEDQATVIVPVFEPNSSVPARNQGYISTRPSTRRATQKSFVGEKLVKKKIYCKGAQRLSTVTFLEQVLSGELDLNPDYQRGVVWTDDKQSKLIESLMYDYNVPPLLICDFTEGDRAGTSTCIDGKQRITSICRFLNGEIPVVLDVETPSGRRTRKYWMKKDEAHKGRRILPKEMAAEFRKLQITYMAYQNLSPEIEREMFQRVQLGMALKPSDRLGAINGAWGDLMRDLHAHIISTPGFEGYFDWGAERGKDYQALAQIIYLAVHGATPRKGEPTSTRIEAFLSNPDENPSRLKKIVFTSIDTFCRIATNPALNDPLTKDVAPLEFVLSVYLIIRYQTQLSDSQMSEAIRLLRNHAKGRKKGGKVVDSTRFKTLLDFIHRSVKALHSKGDLDTMTSSTEEDPDPDIQSQHPAPAAPQMGRRTKRNRTRNNSDSDDDYVLTKKIKKSSSQASAAATKSILAPKTRPSNANTTIKKPSPGSTQSIAPETSQASVKSGHVESGTASGSASHTLPRNLKFNKSPSVALSASGSTSKEPNATPTRARPGTSVQYTPPSSPQNSEEMFRNNYQRLFAREPSRSIAERTSQVLASKVGKD